MGCVFAKCKYYATEKWRSPVVFHGWGGSRWCKTPNFFEHLHHQHPHHRNWSSMRWNVPGGGALCSTSSVQDKTWLQRSFHVSLLLLRLLVLFGDITGGLSQGTVTASKETADFFFSATRCHYFCLPGSAGGQKIDGRRRIGQNESWLENWIQSQRHWCEGFAKKKLV